MPIVITRQEVEEMYSNIEFEKNDIGMTWIHKMADMSPVNRDECCDQLTTWSEVQSTGEYFFECLEENYMELNTFDGKKWYIAVVQQLRPNGEEIDMDHCQMSLMLFNFMTKGFVTAFFEEEQRNIFGKYVREIPNIIKVIDTCSKEELDKYMIEFKERVIREEQELTRQREAERERLRREQEAERERLRREAERLRVEAENAKAEEAKTKLEAEEKAKKDAEELKKSLPKKKKEKKVKEAKVAVNPHKKDIRISEGIWKPNPAWKKWEQENKRSASPP
jgi:hypothetical protein